MALADPVGWEFLREREGEIVDVLYETHSLLLYRYVLLITIKYI
jgi:hypothetical protein